MDIIFCIVGPSGSGKTTLAKMLEKDFNVIQSFTTRPEREPLEWGHTFTDVFIDTGDVIAYNKFHEYEYWATKAQYEGKGKTVYIIDPAGDEMLRKEIDVKVVTIFLRVSEEEVYKRLRQSRGMLQAYDRMNHDRAIFASVKCDHVVNADISIYRVESFVRDIFEEY